VIDAVAVAKRSQTSPYRGIHPFRYADRTFFCGRNELIEDLGSNVFLHRLVVLFGRSGAGKSSVINAGLVPVLEKEGLKCERLRIGTSPEYPILVERIVGDNDVLQPSIFDESGETDPVRFERTIPLSLEAFLSRAKKFAELNPKVATPTLGLIFDQFEELFTRFEFARVSPGPDRTPWQRRLTDTIVNLATEGSRHLRLLLVIREDFLADLEVMARDYPRVLDYRVRVTYLNGSEAVSAILDPLIDPDTNARRFSSVIDPDLAEIIVKDITRAQAFASRPDKDDGKAVSEDQTSHTELTAEPLVPPTQVQIVCSELWDSFADRIDSIGIDQYREKEGLQGILDSWFESQLNKLGVEIRRPAILILQNLITEIGTRDVVSEQLLRDLVLRKDVAEPDFSAALKSLLDDLHLVESSSQRGTHFYEVASEYLIPSIQKTAQDLAKNEAAEKAAREAKEAAEKAAQKAKEAADKAAQEAKDAADKAAREAKEAAEKAARESEVKYLKDLAAASREKAETQRQRAEEQKQRAEEKAAAARKMTWLVAALAIVCTICACLAVAYSLKRASAQRLYRQSHSRELALEAEKQSNSRLRVLLARKAVYVAGEDKKVSGESQSALQLALAVQSQIPLSPNLATAGVTISGDWKRVATINPDGSIDIEEAVYQPVKYQASADHSPAGVVPVTDSNYYTSQGFSRGYGLKGFASASRAGVANPSCKLPVSSLPVTDGDLSPVTNVDLWKANNVRIKVTLLDAHATPTSLRAFSPDGKYLAFTSTKAVPKAGSVEQDVMLWNVESGSGCEWFVLPRSASSVSALAFGSPESGLLAIGNYDGTAKLLNVHTKQEVRTLNGHNVGGQIQAFTFSTDGKRLASAGADSTVSLWNVETGEELHVLNGNKAYVSALAFSGDGKLLATGHSDGVRVWNADTGQLGNSFAVPAPASIQAVAFNEDGNLLAAASFNVAPKVTIYNLKTGVVHEPAVLKDHILIVGMNDVGSWFMTITDNGSFTRYNVEPTDAIKQADGYMRPFTPKECEDYVQGDLDCNDFYKEFRRLQKTEQPSSMSMQPQP
jgi:WD40 repeat protein